MGVRCKLSSTGTQGGFAFSVGKQNYCLCSRNSTRFGGNLMKKGA